MAASGGFVRLCRLAFQKPHDYRSLRGHFDHVIDNGYVFGCLALRAVGFRILGAIMLRGLGCSDAASERVGSNSCALRLQHK
jgi:hypothetical protein